MLKNTLKVFGSISILFLFIAYSQPMFFVDEIYPKEVKPGEIYNLTIVLVNLGNEFATYLRVSLDPNDISPIDPIGKLTYFTKKVIEAKQSEEFFGAVRQYEKINITIPIFVKLNTPDNVYLTPLILRYKNPDMKELSQTLYFGILVRGYISIGISSLKIDPSDIRAGDKNIRLRIYLKNSGTSTAEDVVVTLNVSYPFKHSYSNLPKMFLGTLRAGEIKYVEYFIDVDKNARSGEYNISLNIDYKDKYNMNYNIVKKISIVIKPRPYLDVVKHFTVPNILYNGEKGKLYVTIKNLGEDIARNIELRVIPDISHPIEFDEKTFFISSLKNNETARAVFKFRIDRTAAEGEYVLKLVIRYNGNWEENDYNVYTKESSVKIYVKEKTSSFGSFYIRYYFLILLLSMLILIVLILKKIYRRR